MSKQIRRFLRVTSLLILIVICVGCQKKPDNTAENFLSSFAKKDLSACYSMFSQSAKAKISQEDFTKKINSIIDGIKIESIEFSEIKESEKNGHIYFTYKMAYDTQIAGKLENSYTMEVQKEDDKYVVIWDPSLIFPQMDWGDTVRTATIKPKRGEIFASDGTLLAKNTSYPCVYAIPDKIDNPSSAADALAPLLKMSSGDILKAMLSKEAERDKYVVLKVYDTESITDSIRSGILKIKGVGIDASNYVSRRYYPFGKELAHTIGYVGVITEEEYKQKKDSGYLQDDIIGKTGLEAQYETQLRGEAGFEIFIQGEDLQKKKSIYKKPAKDGEDLRLSIDALLQKTAYDALAQSLGEGQSGSAIVLNPVTGEVKAIANYPSFDANSFVKGISKEDYAALQDPKAQNPLFNRAMKSLLPPGSVYKPFTATLGLETNTVTPSTTFDLKIEADTWRPEWNSWVYPPIKRVEAPPHKLNLNDALIWSDNIYFANLGIKIGKNAFLEYAHKIGLDEAVPFDLPVSKAQITKDETDFNEKMLADSAYGQNEMLLTPLQAASMYTAFLNNGNMIAPRLVNSLCHSEGKDYITDQKFETKVWKESVIKKETIAILQPIMQKVITEGTGKSLNVQGATVAGKTGTAEIDKIREISWFAGYWVGGSEQRLVLVMVDGPANEGNVKFNIARPLLTPPGR